MALGNDDILLGSGSLYVVEVTSSFTIPTTVEDIKDLCVEDNRIGHIKDGATLSINQTFYTAKDDLNLVKKVIVSDEDITWKSGIMTWVPSTVEKLVASAHAYTSSATSSAQGKKGVRLGGLENVSYPKYYCVFKHQDGIHYVVFVGQSQTSLEVAFKKDAETVVDCTFSVLPELEYVEGSTSKKYCVDYFEVVPTV